jgi:hypothetical protein
MATKLASEVKAGDTILLKDGKTRVTVIEAITNLRSHVQISWIDQGKHDYCNYHKDDEITVIGSDER